MNIALIHDSLTEFGGAERILKVFLDLFPDADIYTAFYDQAFVDTLLTLKQQTRLRASWLQHVPVRHHTSFIQALSPLVWKSFRLDSYDLVISHGAHIMSNLVSVRGGTHITYISSPPKNIIGMVAPTPLQRRTRYDKIIGPIYKNALAHMPYIIANSKHTQSMLRQRLTASSTVIYPPVRIPTHMPKKMHGDYFMCVSRIEPNKHLEIAIQAANMLQTRLKIVGVSNTPWYEKKLHALAGPTIEFLGYQSDQAIEKLYTKATAFIFPSKSEDFGIAPLEASAHGVPVIAYRGGGARETIVEGVTGTFFYTHTPKSLIQQMMRIQTMHFSPKTLYLHAKKFSEERFRKEIMSYVLQLPLKIVPDKE